MERAPSRTAMTASSTTALLALALLAPGALAFGIPPVDLLLDMFYPDNGCGYTNPYYGVYTGVSDPRVYVDEKGRPHFAATYGYQNLQLHNSCVAGSPVVGPQLGAHEQRRGDWCHGCSSPMLP